MQTIYRIDLSGVNAFLMEKDGNFLLIDTGGHIYREKNYSDKWEILDQVMEKHGVNPSNFHYLLLTHGDNDHVANAFSVHQKYGGKTGIHRDDRHFITDPTPEDYIASNYFRSSVTNFLFKATSGDIRKEGARVASEMKPLKPDFILEDGMDIPGFDLKVIHVPGHTLGSVAFLDSLGNLISGDLFINKEKPRVTLIASNFAAMEASVKKILALPVTTIYPGHGAAFPLAELNLTDHYKD